MTINDNPILAQVVLGYSPMIDRERSVSATRLTVFPVRPDAPLDAKPFRPRIWLGPGKWKVLGCDTCADELK